MWWATYLLNTKDYQILAAALAVAGKGFLSLLIKSEGDAAAKLTEIYHRRAQAQALLVPCLEALPQLLIIPFVLFILGLLDNLLSNSFSNINIILPTLISSITSCILVVTVGILLVCAVVHGILHPGTSPFQTLISQRILRPKSSRKAISDEFLEERALTHDNHDVFHLVLQETFEDEVLDQASAALGGILFDNIGKSASLTDRDIQTILHLLSPEASLRSNLSAARVVMRFSPDFGMQL